MRKQLRKNLRKSQHNFQHYFKKIETQAKNDFLPQKRVCRKATKVQTSYFVITMPGYFYI